MLTAAVCPTNCAEKADSQGEFIMYVLCYSKYIYAYFRCESIAV